jgi:Ulp1 family protease
VRRWTTKAKLGRLGQAAGCVLECDLLVVPVHEGSHWTCAAIDLRPGRRCLVYYDSLGGKNTAVLDHLARWVTDEAKVRGEGHLGTGLCWGACCPWAGVCQQVLAPKAG